MQEDKSRPETESKPEEIITTEGIPPKKKGELPELYPWTGPKGKHPGGKMTPERIKQDK